MIQASLFSGIEGFGLAAAWMGWETAFYCEINEFCIPILKYYFPNSVHYGNIKEVDFTKWRGRIDILTGGFPCQPFSIAGDRKGADDDRYLWPEMLRAIREIRPSWVIGENVAGIVSMVQPCSETEVEHQASLFEEDNKETILEQEYVIETICRDFEREGYSVQPIIIPACAVGAPHRRDRVWFIANRTDAGVKSMQRKGENGIFKSCLASDPNRNRNSWLSGNSNGQKKGEKIGKNLQCKATGYGSERTVTDSHQFNGNVPGLCSDRISQFQTSGMREDREIDEYSNGERCKEFHALSLPDKKTGIGRVGLIKDWTKWPTQSPVCGRNDGVPARLDGITLSKWRNESIKGFGNAIVPQVYLEICRAIECVEQ